MQASGVPLTCERSENAHARAGRRSLRHRERQETDAEGTTARVSITFDAMPFRLMRATRLFFTGGGQIISRTSYHRN